MTDVVDEIAGQLLGTQVYAKQQWLADGCPREQGELPCLLCGAATNYYWWCEECYSRSFPGVPDADGSAEPRAAYFRSTFEGCYRELVRVGDND